MCFAQTLVVFKDNKAKMFQAILMTTISLPLFAEKSRSTMSHYCIYQLMFMAESSLAPKFSIIECSGQQWY
jgi:hypothetical protein